ncbi:EF-hand domain-containing protein [Taklimakanibacter deserti]|uniref:EF-hand domain-containing protein n=1 Tax=Taklimakanibacter deserti TaxID=2267839 RepID=UPI000E646B4C
MQNKTKLTLAILTLSALGLGTLTSHAMADRGGRCGWGGHPGGGPRHLMQRYDTNKDGKVSQPEVDANRTEWHARFDADKNGSLSLKEFEALWLEAHRQQMIREFQRLDPNGDAVLTLDEYAEPMSRIVANRDRNGDGVLSREDRRGEGMHRWHRDHDRDDDNDDDGGTNRQ